jgi:DNA-binding MarR family transcriptional regulator
MWVDKFKDVTGTVSELLVLMPELIHKFSHPSLLQEANPAENEAWHDVTELRATPGQLRLMRSLVKFCACRMQELADMLGVTPSTATSMVKRLVAHGYIERSRDESDWRSVWVKPTERGKRALELFDQARVSLLQKRFEKLTIREQENIAAALPALRRLLEQE